MTKIEYDVDLGGGLTAHCTIQSVDPEPAPLAGDDWPADQDGVAVLAVIELPMECSQCGYADGSPSGRRGERLASLRLNSVLFGTSSGGIGWHYELTYYGPSERELVRQAREEIEASLAPLIAHHARRLARLAVRERRLAAGHDAE